MVQPHLRGAYGRGLLVAASAPRFIPTYVGHTARAADRDAGRAVHPHIRGAYDFTDTWGKAVVGSSPHMWGIPLG